MLQVIFYILYDLLIIRISKLQLRRAVHVHDTYILSYRQITSIVQISKHHTRTLVNRKPYNQTLKSLAKY